MIFIVARDFLPILGFKVDVKRLFNIIRDILGIWRMSISAKTLKALILLKDYICWVIASQVYKLREKFDLVPPIRQYEPFINGSLPLMNVPPIGQWEVY